MLILKEIKLTTKMTMQHNPQNNIKDGKKKLALALAALGAMAVAGVAIYKGKGTKLSNITFNKGIAFSQNGDKFTGKIKDKLSNGDKIVMEYADGVLQKSTRSGQVNFEKVYETVNNEKIVKKTVDGVTREFNITKAQEEVKTAQEKLKSLINDDKLSSDELKKQTDAIKFKSNNQKKEIETIISSKKKVEAEAKAKLDAEASTRQREAYKKKLAQEKQARKDLFSEAGLKKLEDNSWAKELYDAWIEGKGTYRYDYDFIDGLFKAQVDKETGKIIDDVNWHGLYRLWEFG